MDPELQKLLARPHSPRLAEQVLELCHKAAPGRSVRMLRGFHDARPELRSSRSFRMLAERLQAVGQRREAVDAWLSASAFEREPRYNLAVSRAAWRVVEHDLGEELGTRVLEALREAANAGWLRGYDCRVVEVLEAYLTEPG